MKLSTKCKIGLASSWLGTKLGEAMVTEIPSWRCSQSTGVSRSKDKIHWRQLRAGQIHPHNWTEKGTISGRSFPPNTSLRLKVPPLANLACLLPWPMWNFKLCLKPWRYARSRPAHWSCLCLRTQKPGTLVFSFASIHTELCGHQECA